MRQYATTNKVLFTKPTAHGWDTVEVTSKSNPRVKYTVDMTHGRCSCPAWLYQKGGERLPCKHLRALGFTAVATGKGMEFNEPNKQPKIKQVIDLTQYEAL